MMDNLTKANSETLQKPHPPPVVPNLPRPVEVEPDYFPWLSALAFLFLTFNCVQAVYRARHDPWTISFVVSAYSALVLLFWCLRQLERLPSGAPAGPRERRLKLSVWALAMLLNAMFSYRVATMMPPVLSAVVWTVAAVTTLAGFYAFFLYGNPTPGAAATPAVAPLGKV